MKAYKGFTKDMKCRDFQYEEGGEYEQSGEIKCCENGFHACESPLDCFSYYAPADSVYHEVELDGKIATEENGNDTKVAASKIKIGAELNFFGIAKAHVEWVKENVKNCKTNTGDYSAATNTGYQSAATVEGKNSVALAWGMESKAKASIGSYIVLAEWEETKDGYSVKCAKIEKVDGKDIKADTFYMLKDGKIVEVKE